MKRGNLQDFGANVMCEISIDVRRFNESKCREFPAIISLKISC